MKKQKKQNEKLEYVYKTCKYMKTIKNQQKIIVNRRENQTTL